MKKGLISIIIPVYNQEKYLKRCVQSLLDQTYKNTEILLINDGSTDKTAEICNELSVYDNRIKVFHKQNGGVSTARNIGLKNVTGEYIGFVDPDDYVENDMYEKLHRKIIENNSDIAMCKYRIVDNDTTKIVNHTFSDEFISGKELLDSILKIQNMGALWNKLFKSSLFKKGEEIVLFDEDLNYCEDVHILCRVLPDAKKIVLCEEAFYNYIQYAGSLSNSNLNDKKMNLITAMDKIVKECEAMNSETLKNAYYMYMVNNARCYIQLKNSLESDLNERYIKRIKANLKKSLEYLDAKGKLKVYFTLFCPKIYYKYKISKGYKI